MEYEFTVIGAGPAGIAAVGKLIDFGISAQRILWIDPEFSVGDFGTVWKNVSSNTTVGIFQKFLNSCQAFDYKNAPDFSIKHIDPKSTCDLKEMAQPLLWITEALRNKVISRKDFVNRIIFTPAGWNIQLNDSQITTRKVIIATGAESKTLDLPVTMVTLADALDKELVKTRFDTNDTVAVFGSSHSAILVLRNLIENNVKSVINIYRSPLLYAIYYDDWILYDDSGLKAGAADWARIHIEGVLPENLRRLHSEEIDLKEILKLCNKVVYAIGFEPRKFPVIEYTEQKNNLKIQGMLAPGVFGLGIAYPEAKYNRLGMLEYRVGLWKFMEYLQMILPKWIDY